MPDAPTALYLMLIRVSETVASNPSLAAWISEIETDYMEEFGSFGASIAHLALTGPWHFALVFPGSEQSVAHLTNQIRARASDTDILTMSGTDLDQWRAQHA